MKQIIVNNIGTSYYITEDGKCYNSKTNKWLKGQTNYKNGYLSYQISLKNGKKKRFYAHRLVAKAFIPNPDDKAEVNHIDGNKMNNHVYNLEWVTPKENSEHANKNELKKLPHIYCFTRDRVLVAEYKNIQEASRAVNITAQMIVQEVNKDKNIPKSLVASFFWSKEPVLGETIFYPNTGKAKRVNQYDLKGRFITSYPSTGVAAKSLGVKNPSHIGECCRGKKKKYKDFIWRYADDIVSPLEKSKENV